jgi:preprotein translocase subunit YajC
MKKSIIITSVIAVVVIGGIATYLITRTNGVTASQSNTSSSLTPAQEQGQPARSAEIKGIVKSIEGNEVLIANEIDTVELTTEQQAAKKAERQALSQEERQALKAQETAAAEIENVNIMIPVGVPIKKTTGDASGTLVEAELADIKEGTYVSIWANDYKTDKQTIVFVKVKATTN